MKVANCGHDEKGGYTGGIPGDQRGDEWNIVDYYVPSYGWSYHIKWKDDKLAKLFAELAIASARNNNVGYCQGHRSTFYTALKKVNYDPSLINEPCEADCSSGVIALVKAVGYIKNIFKLKNIKATTTRDLYTALKNTGYFELTYDIHYVGEINLTPGHHTNIIVEVGTKSNSKHLNYTMQPAYYKDNKLSGKYKVITKSDNLMVRNGAGDNKKVITSIPKDAIVICYGYYNVVGATKWLYIITTGGTIGYCSSKYLEKVG